MSIGLDGIREWEYTRNNFKYIFEDIWDENGVIKDNILSTDEIIEKYQLYNTHFLNWDNDKYREALIGVFKGNYVVYDFDIICSILGEDEKDAKITLKKDIVKHSKRSNKLPSFESMGKIIRVITNYDFLKY